MVVDIHAIDPRRPAVADYVLMYAGQVSLQGQIFLSETHQKYIIEGFET
jgi:hypothetical protein